jgi:hypothetical protein
VGFAVLRGLGKKRRSSIKWIFGSSCRILSKASNLRL